MSNIPNLGKYGYVPQTVASVPSVGANMTPVSFSGKFWIRLLLFLLTGLLIYGVVKIIRSYKPRSTKKE